MGIVTCGGCGLKFNRSVEDAEFIKSKWYHTNCAKVKHEKIALDQYICKVFGLKTPGPMNNILIKKYRDEMGYNYDGMLKSLKYFYEIKKHSTDKSEERIGIIPYVYTDAQNYFERIENQSERIARHAIKEKEVGITVNINNQESAKKQNNKDELDSLFDEE